MNMWRIIWLTWERDRVEMVCSRDESRITFIRARCIMLELDFCVIEPPLPF